ncbi:MAG TPA: hypothetical protein VMM38_10630 [Aridibacter sp.]|nr:hypothetical protein [Aridibacter sp.]
MRAKDCGTCEVQGICCTDEHFVNVRVTLLEAEAIGRAIGDLPREIRVRVLARTYAAAKEFDDARGCYSCPLFEPEAGCLVHVTTKPLPCIHHACYERPENLPPDSLLKEAEREIVRLNSRTYGNGWSSEAIPVAILRLASKNS